MNTMNSRKPLADLLGRIHSSVQISVTDRCNIRCFYCMPTENVVFRPRAEILSFEEIVRMARIFVTLGVDKFRVTGGEPLVRTDLPGLVERLADLRGIRDLALTTNGMLLADQAEALKRAGLQRLNISLDTLREEVFEEITRRSGLSRVLEGIEAAQRAGFSQIRLNSVAIRGIAEEDIVPLGRFARERGLHLRFIEFMPLDADGNWQATDVLSGATIRDWLEAEFGPLDAVERSDPSQPAIDYQFRRGGGRVGFINSVSEPFCASCNRLRMTADGQLRNCLFSTQDWDARQLLRSGASDKDLCGLIRDCVLAKAPAHGIGTQEFERPERAMYQIGG